MVGGRRSCLVAQHLGLLPEPPLPCESEGSVVLEGGEGACERSDQHRHYSSQGHGSETKASEGDSQSVTRSVSSSSSLSTEVSSDSGGYTIGYEEDYGSAYDSDGERGGVQLDERGEKIASIAKELPYQGIMLLLFETPSGFALFSFFGGHCYLPDSVDNLWAEFGDPHKAEFVVFVKAFVSLENKSRAITDAGVDREVAAMIKKWHRPGMKLCVANTEYKRIIEWHLEIPCMCCQTVMEIMWGIQQQMSSLVPTEKSKLTKKDRLPMSLGLKKFLCNYGYDVKPEMVNEKIVATACSLFHCDVDDERNLGLLRDAGLHIGDVSGIPCKDWDILKLAIAVKVIFSPEEEPRDFHRVLPEHVVSKLKRDAPKYKGSPIRFYWLRAYKAALDNHHLRIANQELLSTLVKEAKEAYEVGRSSRQNRKLCENRVQRSNKRRKN